MNPYEIPKTNEGGADNSKEQLEKNKKIKTDIVRKLAEFYDFIFKENRDTETGNVKPSILTLRNTPFFYSTKDFPKIEEIITNLGEKLTDLAKNPSVKFSNNHLDHMLANSPVGKIALADRKTRIMTEKGLEGAEKVSDSSHEVFEDINDAKETLDLFLLYMELLSDDENILKSEVEDLEGWRETFSSFYKSEEDGGVLKTEDGKTVLSHINFFARLGKWKTQNSSMKGMESYATEINSENFDLEFDKLIGKELLDKERIKSAFLNGEFKKTEPGESALAA